LREIYERRDLYEEEKIHQPYIMPDVAEEKRMDYLGFCKEADEYNRETLKRHAEEEA